MSNTTLPHDEGDIETCYWHPQTETTLHCYQCGKPICVKCTRRTPVGYICKDCSRGRKQRFEQSKPTDYVIAAVASMILGGVASLIPSVGSWWFLIFLSPLSGVAVSEIVRRLVGRRYGQHLWWIVAVGIVVGTLPVLALTLLGVLGASGNSGMWGLLRIGIVALHIVLAVGSAIARLK